MMKITGELVDMLLRVDPEKFRGYVAYEKEQNVIYLVLLRAIYGMLFASLIWYQKFNKDMKSIGFLFNNYGPCVANRMFNKKHHTFRFHVTNIL